MGPSSNLPADPGTAPAVVAPDPTAGPVPANLRREVKAILVLEWLEPRAPRLAAVCFWLYNRLTGTRCYATGCGRLLLAHTPRQYNRCLDTPLAIELTDRGWLRANGLDPEAVAPVSMRADSA
jgi:hypothetical protein